MKKKEQGNALLRIFAISRSSLDGRKRPLMKSSQDLDREQFGA
jgi:hypothetical protein